jgi:ATP-dependent helicase/nuclease subunit A
VVILIDADRAPTDRSTEVRLNPGDDTSGLVFGARKALREGFRGAEELLDSDLLKAAATESAASAVVEENNLLYVALTRARDRLYLIGGKSSAKDEALKTFLSRTWAAATASSGPVVCEDGAKETEAAIIPGVAAKDGSSKPLVRIWQPPVMGERLRTVLPSSDLGPPPVPATGPLPPSESGLSPRDFGILVHRLLEQAATTGAVPAGESAAFREARAVFTAGDLQWIFDPAAHERGLCEVPVIHRTRAAGPQAVEERTTGVIDRLVLRPGRVDVIDYKTNRLGGDPAYREALIAHYRPQMEAYRAAAGALFPGRAVHAWLLFTDPGGGGLMECGEDRE